MEKPPEMQQDSAGLQAEGEFLRELKGLSEKIGVPGGEIARIFLSSLMPHQLVVDVAESGGRNTQVVLEELKRQRLLSHITEDVMSEKPKEFSGDAGLDELANLIREAAQEQDVSADRIVDIFINSIEQAVFMEKLALSSFKDPRDLSRLLKGFPLFVLIGTSYRLKNLEKEATGEKILIRAEDLFDSSALSYTEGLIEIKVTFPGEGLAVDKGIWEAVRDHFEAVANSTAKRSYNYRGGVMKYFEEEFKKEKQFYEEYLQREFYSKGLKVDYLISSGIGGNELFSHGLAAIHRLSGDTAVKWIVIDSPGDIKNLPKEANNDNTLVIEFSRSGETQETLKIVELTCRRFTRRIAYANKGPLKEFAEFLKVQRGLPVEVRGIEARIGGRLMRRLTPMTYGPMILAGMDAEKYARITDKYDLLLDFSNKEKGLAVGLARFLFVCVVLGKRHDLSCMYNNRELLKPTFYELRQLFMEGANKKPEYPLVMNFNEFPRDAHVSMEGVFAQSHCQVALGLVSRRSGSSEDETKLLEEDLHDKLHLGLDINDIEYCLAHPNILKCQGVMPTISIEIDKMGLEVASALSCLWEDLVVHYCAITGQDPNSNSEVKHVREITGRLLEQKATGKARR
ncbi:MAG: hypothetical protein JW727_01795 [Candidatus Aenigmarchaeota archaeon]|nr:hypothetical protein [Candidatus Aenigmarchaeota archaeon]